MMRREFPNGSLSGTNPLQRHSRARRAGRTKKSAQSTDEIVVATHLALPDNEHGPTHLVQGRLNSGIARAVRVELQPPIVDTGARKCGAGTPRMTVPEAAMNEDHLPAATKDDVRAPRQIPSMQTKPVAAAMQKAADPQLRTRISGADTRHESAALGRRQPIGAHGWRKESGAKTGARIGERRM